MKESTAILLIGFGLLFITGTAEWPKGAFSIVMRAGGDLLIVLALISVRRSP